MKISTRDCVSIVGTVEHDPGGVIVKATAVCGFRQAFGLLTTKPGTPDEEDMLPDLV